MLDFLNQPYKNILIINVSNFLGDFIFYCFYLAFYYKKYYNSHITVIANYKIISFFDNFKDLFSYTHIDNYNGNYTAPDVIFTYNNIIEKTKNIKCDNIYILDKKTTINFITNNIFVHFVRKDFRKDIQSYIKSKFETYKISDNLKNNIIVCFGSITRNKSENNNKLYDQRIDYVIKNNPDKKFILVGSIIKNQNILKNPNVINLLGNETVSLEKFVGLCFNNKLIITRNSGLYHLAGLTNINVIHLTVNFSSLDKLKSKNIIINNKSTKEKNRLFYTRLWSSLSEMQINIIEYKRNNIKYNESIKNIICKYLNIIYNN